MELYTRSDPQKEVKKISEAPKPVMPLTPVDTALAVTVMTEANKTLDLLLRFLKEGGGGYIETRNLIVSISLLLDKMYRLHSDPPLQTGTGGL
jgi:hypothetical protein